MQAIDIGRVTYELVRVHEDRIMMRWEDDRMRLLAEVARLEHVNQKQQRTVLAVRRDYEAFRDIYLQIQGGDQNKRCDMSAKESCVDKKRKHEEDMQQRPPKLRFRELVESDIGQRQNDESHPAAAPPLSASSRTKTALKMMSASPSKASDKGRVKCVEVIRNKAERSVLPGYTCVQCEKYITNLRDQGIVTSEEEVAEMLERCGRHKSAIGPPPSTPDGFWDLTVHTPEEWAK